MLFDAVEDNVDQIEWIVCLTNASLLTQSHRASRKPTLTARAGSAFTSYDGYIPIYKPKWG
jgi:hypothetical protein